MTNDFSPDFSPYLEGIPATQKQGLAALGEEIQAAGSALVNNSPYSPFYSLLGHLVVNPMLYLREVLAKHIMPGMFLHTAQGDLLDLKAAEFGMERLQARAAVGKLLFTRASTLGTLLVPSGTRIESPPIDGKVYALETTLATSFAAGETDTRVAVQALETGAAHNLRAGLYSVLPEPPAGVIGVNNHENWLLKAGRDAETDDALRRRCLLQVQRLGQGTHGYYQAIIAEEARIDPVDIFTGAYGARGFGSRDYHYLLPTGQPSTSKLAEINALLTKQHLDGDSVQVKALPALNVDLVVNLYPKAQTPTEVQLSIREATTTAIRAMFRENAAYPQLPRVAPNKVVPWVKISSLIAKRYPQVQSIDFAPAQLRPALQLPVLNSLTVNVEVA